jgi:imidazole glycerol phosphate synthase glutamine amidotransferase subunit
MSSLIGIVDYGVAGNIHSIQKALRKANANVVVVGSKDELSKVDKIVIPGVGSFHDAIQELRKSDLIDTLKDAIDSKPTLGICLGMQILSKVGFEYGITEGLGKVNAEVKPIEVDAKVPHVGFNRLDIVKHNELLEGIEDEEFYFMHSYEMVNYTDIVSLTEYAGHLFVSSIQKDNIYGVQFHPEKSKEAGIQLFKNFVKL